MEISQARMRNAYSAIADPIMDLRVKLRGGVGCDDLDLQLYELEFAIWQKLALAMNIEQGQ